MTEHYLTEITLMRYVLYKSSQRFAIPLAACCYDMMLLKVLFGIQFYCFLPILATYRQFHHACHVSST